jgi:murein DD-endopeptidase MepM/ murein hydrolase activator NlpD
MVEKGDHIGNSGNSGDTSDGKPYGPHLHYETRDKNGGKYPDNVTQPKQEDLDYLDKQFIDRYDCITK